MAQFTVRKLDDDLVRRLKVRAVRHNRSAEAEHRLILEEVLRPAATDFWSKAKQARDETRGRSTSDSTDIVREDRDLHHKAGT